MGREQEVNRLELLRARAEFERRVGGINPHRVYEESGCPKCGVKNFACAYCTGHDATDSDPRSCPIENEHLHVVCSICKYSWLEYPKDRQAEIDAGPPPASRVSELLAAGFEITSKITAGGDVYVTHASDAMPSQHRRDEPCVVCRLSLLLNEIKQEVEP
jgi:hypothetical protein